VAEGVGLVMVATASLVQGIGARHHTTPPRFSAAFSFCDARSLFATSK
jgi:hypothetical protein